MYTLQALMDVSSAVRRLRDLRSKAQVQGSLAAEARLTNELLHAQSQGHANGLLFLVIPVVVRSQGWWGWFLRTVFGIEGEVMLAACLGPGFTVLLYEPGKPGCLAAGAHVRGSVDLYRGCAERFQLQEDLDGLRVSRNPALPRVYAEGIQGFLDEERYPR